MHINYANRSENPGDLTYSQLTTGHYIGVQTGKLYYCHRKSGGSQKLFRYEDDMECTDRFQRSGTFRRAEVEIKVVGPPWP